MEFEDVSPKVEREARRVAAAFGVEEWEVIDCEKWETTFKGKIGLLEIIWVVDADTDSYSFISLGDGDRFLSFESTRRSCGPPGEELQWYPGQHLLGYPAREPAWYELMVRGLFCLGFEGEGVLS